MSDEFEKYDGEKDIDADVTVLPETDFVSDHCCQCMRKMLTASAKQ
jgi:hypothetical protein